MYIYIRATGNNHTILKYQTFRLQGAFVSGYINMNEYEVTHDKLHMFHALIIICYLSYCIVTYHA